MPCCDASSKSCFVASTRDSDSILGDDGGVGEVDGVGAEVEGWDADKDSGLVRDDFAAFIGPGLRSTFGFLDASGGGTGCGVPFVDLVDPGGVEVESRRVAANPTGDLDDLSRPAATK